MRPLLSPRRLKWLNEVLYFLESIALPPFPSRKIGWLTPVAAAVLSLSAAFGSPARLRAEESSDLAAARQASDRLFAEQLNALAAKCDELGLAAEARTTRDWIVERTPSRQYLFLPDDAAAAVPTDKANDLAQKWYAKLTEHRRAQADRLFDLATQALQAHEPAAAYRLLHEVLHENPDHAQARRVLGYRAASKGNWLPSPKNWPAAVGRTDQPKLGWRRGQYWRIETPHFQIVTNHSPKAGQQLAADLENLFLLWKQTFFSFWSDEAMLSAQFERPRADDSPASLCKVVLFKDRNQYLATLGAGQPQLGLTLGIYLDSHQTAYFYAADPPLEATWRHEITHQLFQEIGRHNTGVGERQNFWIVEGAALYMESLTDHGHYWTTGGWDADRLQPARYRALSGDYLLPFEKLVVLGREDVQHDPDIRKLYSQAAGLTHFLLDGEQGKYREPTVGYLATVYQQSDDPQSLARRTQTSLAELDKQYLAFLQVTDADLLATPNLSHATQLALGRTAVTDAGLAALANCPNLTWLDLSLTKTTNQGLAHLRGSPRLQQLYLEGTQITDASLDLIAGFAEMEELDLSHLRISDAGLLSVGRLKRLKSLYLTGSPITDAGLAHLVPLKQLESIDLRGTRVTAEGVQRLQQAIPKLNVTGP